LLDTRLEYKIGGTGKTHDWQISKEIVKTCKKSVFLAGGLTPENVIDAITKVNPYCVDVNSGVKAKPRIKDHEKLRLFIQNAKSV
jgi:phosphoribosylanthranilate isomerase